MPRIKVSESPEKITNPGLKKIYRVYDEKGKAIADYLTTADEVIDTSEPVRYIDPVKYWKNRSFENCTFKELQVPIFENGELVYQCPPLSEVREYVKRQLEDEIWAVEKRFENPHTHFFDLSPKMYELKMSMLHESRH